MNFDIDTGADGSGLIQLTCSAGSDVALLTCRGKDHDMTISQLDTLAGAASMARSYIEANRAPQEYTSEWRVFSMCGGEDWYVARTASEALAAYHSENGDPMHVVVGYSESDEIGDVSECDASEVLRVDLGGGSGPSVSLTCAEWAAIHSRPVFLCSVNY